ncbi:MAG TPA: glycosyltransferase [Rickettsia endosymbiont of Degeeriella rufa]|nr:glycosyltransferase [Rickettsia endosymbiont of Degeeriella rufa]
MKILLLTDIPPCDNYTAGLVLKPLVKFLPLDQIVICTVSHSSLEFKIPEELDKIPHLKLFKPSESITRFKGKKIKTFISYGIELLRALKVKYFLLPKIINFAKKHKVDTIWIILQGQTIVRLARPLAKKLPVPLYTQVWDHFEWRLRSHYIDKYTSKRLLEEFNEVLKYSTCCATASWGMSKEYEAKYNIQTIPIVASLPKELAKSPANASHEDRDVFIIAIAGQLYAQDAWMSFINALNEANWIIGEKRILVRIIGRSEVSTQKSENFEYLGWRPQEEAITLLSDSDLLYLPYWFSEEFYKESSTSFPGKLVTYFAAGRPVFCHAPDYSSPSKYIANNNAGYLCNSLVTDNIIYELEKAITDRASYKQFAKNGHDCFLQDFTLECMRDRFLKFLKLGN